MILNKDFQIVTMFYDQLDGSVSDPDGDSIGGATVRDALLALTHSYNGTVYDEQLMAKMNKILAHNTVWHTSRALKLLMANTNYAVIDLTHDHWDEIVQPGFAYLGRKFADKFHVLSD